MAGWCSWLSRIVNSSICTDKVLGSSPSLVKFFFFFLCLLFFKSLFYSIFFLLKVHYFIREFFHYRIKLASPTSSSFGNSGCSDLPMPQLGQHLPASGLVLVLTDVLLAKLTGLLTSYYSVLCGKSSSTVQELQLLMFCTCQRA